ncbi:MAG TPA: ATP synthase subunit I [Bacillales bacterium]
MKEFADYSKKVFRSTCFALAGVCLLWFVTPYNLFLQGLMLGMVTSLVNGSITWLKTKQITAFAAAGGGRKSFGTGMVSRMALSVFAAYLAYKFPLLFSFTGVLIGLFAVPLFSLIHAFISNNRLKKIE